MAPSGPRQEVKLLVCLYKMLTTSLTALIFWFRKISPLVSKTTHALTGVPVAKWLFLCYLVLLRVLSCTL